MNVRQLSWVLIAILGAVGLSFFKVYLSRDHKFELPKVKSSSVDGLPQRYYDWQLNFSTSGERLREHVTYPLVDGAKSPSQIVKTLRKIKCEYQCIEIELDEKISWSDRVPLRSSHYRDGVNRAKQLDLKGRLDLYDVSAPSWLAKLDVKVVSESVFIVTLKTDEISIWQVLQHPFLLPIRRDLLGEDIVGSNRAWLVSYGGYVLRALERPVSGELVFSRRAEN